MNRKLHLILLAATVAVGTAAALGPGRAQEGPRRVAATQDTARQRLQTLMRQKVNRAEIILRGLAQGDLKSVQRAADELVEIASRANWSVNPNAGMAAANEAEFQRRVALLAKFARDGDLHASYYQFMQVVFQCFDCHEEMRPARR